VRGQEGDLFLDMGTILNYIESERAGGGQSFPLTRVSSVGTEASTRALWRQARSDCTGERFLFAFITIAGPT
jgi:hypothetical protein